MAILAQNVQVVKVRWQNVDLTLKNDKDKLLGMNEDCYVFDRHLYGTDKQFIDAVLTYVKSQYTIATNKIWQVALYPQGTIINNKIL